MIGQFQYFLLSRWLKTETGRVLKSVQIQWSKNLEEDWGPLEKIMKKERFMKLFSIMCIVNEMA